MNEQNTTEQFMKRAIELSEQNIKDGGGPFAAVIVKDGKIIAEGTNRVTSENDPTAHAEVTAIRNAAKKLGTFHLNGCQIFTSCEPCPMCLGASYWAHISKIYYGNSREDAREIGFDDEFIYREIPLQRENRSIPMEELLSDEAHKCFEQWLKKADKIAY